MRPLCLGRPPKISANFRWVSGNAVTDFFFQDVGITQFEFNVGNQLMYLGVTVFEARTPAALWLQTSNLSLACD